MNNNYKCYNYHKLRHFKRDCFFLDKKLNKITQQSQKEES